MPAEDYGLIDELVYRYKNGDSQAALELICTLENYTNKYKYLLKRKIVKYDDIDTRKFLALFVNNPEKRRLLRSSKNTYEVYDVINEIVDLLYKQLYNTSEEDIEQDIYKTILVLAKRYKDQGRNFCSYLYNTFRYEMKRIIEKYVSDPANHPIEFQEYMETHDIYIDGDPILELDDDLDMNWILGHTCSEIFYELTPQERLILKYHYILNYSDAQIAAMLGVHKNTVYNRRHNAIKKIEGFKNRKEES